MEPEKTSRRPLLFPPGTDPGRRRRRTIFAAAYGLIALSVIWPVYPFFSRTFPLVLGLPFSLAWVVMALGLMFGALLWLFLCDHRSQPSAVIEHGAERQ